MNRILLSVSAFLIVTGISDASGPFRLFQRFGRPACEAPPVTPVPRRMPYADDGTTLRIKFAKGEDFYVEMTTKTAQVMKVMGQEVKQTQEQTYVWLMQPLEMTRDGDWLVRMRHVGIRMAIDIGGNKIDYDSRKRPSASPMTDFFESLLQADFIASVQPDGAVRSIQGIDELVKKLARVSSSSALIKSILTEDSMKKSFGTTSDFLPPRPVSPGETWSRRQNLDLGPVGRYTTDYKYTLATVSGPSAAIRFVTKLDYVAPDPKRPEALPFVIKSAEVQKGGGEGTIRFDLHKGRLIDMNQRTTLSANLRIAVGDMDTDVGLEQTQTASVRVLDANPMASAPARAANSGR